MQLVEDGVRRTGPAPTCTASAGDGAPPSETIPSETAPATETTPTVSVDPPVV
jgi:hypothetical protein